MQYLTMTNTKDQAELLALLGSDDAESMIQALQIAIGMLASDYEFNYVPLVIKKCSVLEDALLKKYLYLFFELIPKYHNKQLLGEILLIINFIRKDLNSPNEYVRVCVMRFLCKVHCVEIIENIIPALKVNFDSRHAIVRRWARYLREVILEQYSIEIAVEVPPEEPVREEAFYAALTAFSSGDASQARYFKDNLGKLSATRLEYFIRIVVAEKLPFDTTLFFDYIYRVPQLLELVINKGNISRLPSLMKHPSLTQACLKLHLAHRITLRDPALLKASPEVAYLAVQCMDKRVLSGNLRSVTFGKVLRMAVLHLVKADCPIVDILKGLDNHPCLMKRSISGNMTLSYCCIVLMRHKEAFLADNLKNWVRGIDLTERDTLTKCILRSILKKDRDDSAPGKRLPSLCVSQEAEKTHQLTCLADPLYCEYTYDSVYNLTVLNQLDKSVDFVIGGKEHRVNARTLKNLKLKSLAPIQYKVKATSKVLNLKPYVQDKEKLGFDTWKNCQWENLYQATMRREVAQLYEKIVKRLGAEEVNSLASDKLAAGNLVVDGAVMSILVKRKEVHARIRSKVECMASEVSGRLSEVIKCLNN